METIVVFSRQNNNRLKYVFDWLLKERLRIDYQITTNEQDLSGLPFFIAYGKSLPGAVSIPDVGLLWQSGKEKCNIETGSWNNIPTLFAQAASGCTLPFDLFSAVFFLLTRYEEYYDYKPDKHERYPASESILHKNGWLQRPLMDEWVHAFRKQVRQGLAQNPEQPHFTFQPTYDIDMAYSHLHKGFGRIMGAYMRALLKGDVKQISERTQVLKNRQKDPYDSFRWLRQLHREYDIKPCYFVLCSFKTTAFDKNIPPQHPAMMRVIKNLTRDGVIGAHPSYYSMHNDILGEEKKVLEQVSGRDVHISRQHYMRLKMPDTYRLLIQNKITDDYSMGYGAYLGFRAGTGSSYDWFDLEKNEKTDLRIHPFCFMDTTAHFETKLTAAEAFERLEAMSKILEKTGSTLITVFHNFSLGTASEWKGWRHAYEQFLQEKTSHHIEGT